MNAKVKITQDNISDVTVKLTQDNISDASTPDIRAFAEAEVGLSFDEDTSRDYMIEQIFAALAWLRRDPTADATHVLIKIGLSPGDNGTNAVRLGSGGRMMTVQREKEVEVPIAFYNVLQDVNNLGFDVPALDKAGKMLHNSAGQSRIPRTLYPVQVLKFINKGKTD